MPLFHQMINPRFILGPSILESLRKKSEKWAEKWILDAGVGSSTDRPQEASDILRQVMIIPRL